MQPDSSHIRVWEFAGAAHLEADWVREFTADAGKSYPGLPLEGCDGPSVMPSIVHSRGVRAALNVLNGWTRATNAEAPRSAPRLHLTVPNPSDDFSQSVDFERDPTTNLAIGGIRLPDVSVPAATLNGNRSDLDPETFGPGPQCYLSGSFDPWNLDTDSWDGQPGFDPSPRPEPDLHVLYATHRAYVRRVILAMEQSVHDGYLRPVDGARIVLDAGRASVP